jgi:hypothetical protein
VITPGFVVSVLATLSTFVVFLWLLYEDWAVYHSDKHGRPKTRLEDRRADLAYVRSRLRTLASGDNTITAWTRYYERIIDAHGKSHWLIIAAVILGLLVGHLTWH